MLVTTTVQFDRGTYERLEKTLVGKRNRSGKRITKRAVLQFLLDRALKDKGLQEEMFDYLQQSDEE